VRTYLKNFYEQGTSLKPPAGWMHRNRRHFQHRNVDTRRNYFPVPSEVKRIRKFGWNARMATWSGRKIIMNRIIKNRDVLTH